VNVKKNQRRVQEALIANHRRQSETNLPRNSSPHIIYQLLESKYSLKRKEIPEKLETFTEGLQEFFRSGAHMIEKSILKESHTNLGLKYKSREDYRFMNYIDD